MQPFTEEWATALTKALNEDERFVKVSRKRTDTLAFSISDGPAGDVEYVLELKQGNPEVKLAPAPETAARFSADYQTAAALYRGEISGREATMAGRLKSSLPTRKLLPLVPVLEARARVERELNLEF